MPECYSDVPELRFKGLTDYIQVLREDIMNRRWRPQVMTAMLCVTIIALVVTVLAPEHIELIAGGAVTGIGMLGMKLLSGND